MSEKVRGVGFEPTNPFGKRFLPEVLSLPPLTWLGDPRSLSYSKTYYFGLFLSFRMRLSEVFASRVQARVLEELLNSPHTIFTQVELARRAGCSSSSVDRALKNLMRLGLIRTERLSVNKIVALNLNSRVVSLLIQFNRDVKKADRDTA